MLTMWPWKRTENVRKTSVSDDFEARLTSLESKYNALKREVVEITMDVDTMRNKVMRKIQRKRDEEEEEDTKIPHLDGLPRVK